MERASSCRVWTACVISCGVTGCEYSFVSGRPACQKPERSKIKYIYCTAANENRHSEEAERENYRPHGPRPRARATFAAHGNNCIYSS